MNLNTTAVAELIKRSGFRNLSHFASVAGISPGALADLMSGRKRASYAMIAKIRKALAVPLPAIICDPETDAP